MLRKTACFFLKIAYASRLMTLRGIAYRGSHRKIEWGLSKIFSKKIKKFFKNPLTNQKYVL